MSEPCAWLTYDANGNEFVFANYQDAERFVGDSEDAEMIHPLVMAADLAALQRDAERWRECERLARIHPAIDLETWALTIKGGDTFASAIDDSIKRREQA